MLLRRCGILRGCLYDSRNGIKNKMGDFFPAFICRFFQPARVDLMGWFLFRLLNVESSRWLENFSCCRKLNKTNFPHSMFRFNSTLLLFINLRTLWNQKHECSRKYITHKKSSHASLSCWECSEYVVVMLAGFSQKPHWKRSLLVTFFVCCSEFMCGYLNMFDNFRGIFFPPTLVGCFSRMLNKQAYPLKKD